MSSRWTPERKARQAELIKAWQPWEQSTGAKTPEGKATVSRNAFKGGHRPILRQVIRSNNSQIEQLKVELESAGVDRKSSRYLATILVAHQPSVDAMIDELISMHSAIG